MLKPDIFVPGNHEFDFGKANFLERMAEANSRVYAANLRDADGQPLPGFKDRAIVTVDGVRIGLTGATYRRHAARRRSPEDLKFLPTVADHAEQAETLRREGADFVVAVMHADRRQGDRAGRTRSVDLVLTGHNHDLFIQFDGRHAMVESGYDAHYVTLIDVTIDVKEQDGRRTVTVVAAVPRHRHRDGHARPRGRGGGRRASSRSSTARWTCRSAPPRSSSTAATPPCAAARPRSAI